MLNCNSSFITSVLLRAYKFSKCILTIDYLSIQRSDVSLKCSFGYSACTINVPLSAFKPTEPILTINYLCETFECWDVISTLNGPQDTPIHYVCKLTKCTKS